MADDRCRPSVWTKTADEILAPRYPLVNIRRATRSVGALRRDYYVSLGDGSKQVGDPATTSLVTFAFDFPTRAAVDAFIAKAEAAGAKLGSADDYGFMYQRQFEYPDGNQFAPFWMNPDGPPAE